jgi:hypothetical protein
MMTTYLRLTFPRVLARPKYWYGVAVVFVDFGPCDIRIVPSADNDNGRGRAA